VPDEMPGDDLIGQEHATSVDVEIDVPFVVGQLKHMLHRRNARIGHENLASPNCPRACLNPRSTEARSTSTKRCRRRFRCCSTACLNVPVGDGYADAAP
jgi:hypothetical protein